MTRTGFINIGYKKANPNLTPEILNNLETAWRYSKNNYSNAIVVYYSKGYDFMYYVATGESIFGGRKKVYEKRNVSEVKIYGIEISLGYKLNENIKFCANYTYNNSYIIDFPERTDLIGKKLAYTPENTINVISTTNYKKLYNIIKIKYQDSYYLDEENTTSVQNIFDIDWRLHFKFYKNAGIGITIQNILDNKYMVSSDQMSIGRFIMFNIDFEY